jgi:DNA-binding IscR family transcriptional regulator
METKELVLKTLQESGKPMKSAEIAAQAGIDKAVVDKAIQSLKKEEKIVSPKVCYYSVK